MADFFSKNGDQVYYEALAGDQASSEAVLFLHGYPADKGSKNRDIAEMARAGTGFDCFLIHYPGLGRSAGAFSFQKAIEVANSFSHFLFQKYSKVNVFGHSFGGLVAIELLKRNPQNIESLFLASPFTQFPEGEGLRKLTDLIYSQTSAFLEHLTPEEFFADAAAVAEKFNPRKDLDPIDTLGRRFSIIQAINDDEVPVESTASFAKLFRRAQVEYVEIDTDHSFSDKRSAVADFLIGFLVRGQ